MAVNLTFNLLSHIHIFIFYSPVTPRMIDSQEEAPVRISHPADAYSTELFAYILDSQNGLK